MGLVPDIKDKLIGNFVSSFTTAACDIHLSLAMDICCFILNVDMNDSQLQSMSSGINQSMHLCLDVEIHHSLNGHGRRHASQAEHKQSPLT